MLKGLGTALNFDVKKPKISFADLKKMNETDKDQVMNLIMSRDKKMQQYVEKSLHKVEEAHDEVEEIHQDI